MGFEILGEISQIEVIPSGTKLRQRRELRKQYGQGHWRRLKGIARIRFEGGQTRPAEIHWYEAHGIGRRRFKIKRFLD